MTAPGTGKILLRRALLAVVLLVLLLVPSFALMGITGQAAATYAAMGTLIGAVALFAGGLRVAILTALVTALIAPVAIMAGLSPVTGAALMALMTLTVGGLARVGLHRATMLVPILMAWPVLAPIPWLPHDQIVKLNALLAEHGMSLADAITKVQDKGTGAASSSSSGASDAVAHMLTQQRMDSTYLASVGLYFLIGALIPVLLWPLLRHRVKPHAPETHGRSETLPYTLTITVLAAAGTYYFLDHPKMTGGAFLIATILVLTQVGTQLKWKLTIERVLGTVAGMLLFGLVVWAAGGNTFVEFLGLPFPLKMYGIGALFGAFAIMAKFGPKQWLYYLFMVPTTALLNAFTFSQAGDLGEARVVDNLVGAVLVILAGLITIAAGRIEARRAAKATATA